VGPELARYVHFIELLVALGRVWLLAMGSALTLLDLKLLVLQAAVFFNEQQHIGRLKEHRESLRKSLGIKIL
jgi:hypothetical protein